MSEHEMLPTSGPGPAEQPRHRTLARRAAKAAGILFGVTVFAGAAVAGIAALHLRTAAEEPRSVVPPVRVETVRAAMVDGFDLITHYTGRLEAARTTALAFERGGLVLAVGLDEGDTVARGQVVARLDTAKLEAGRAQLEARRRELEAQKNLAAATFARQSKLKTEGWSPDQKFDEAEAAVAQLDASIEQVTAEIAGIDIDIAKSRLEAPFDGTMAGRFIDEGAVVAAGTPVATLLETGRRQVRVGLPPDVTYGLDPDATFALHSNGVMHQARLIARRPDLDTGTRTVTVLFDVTETTGDAALGDLVTLAIARHVDTRGTWLPLTALKEGRRGLWTVLVAGRAGDTTVVRPEAVELLHAEDDRVYVRGTLRDGDHVLSGGTDRVVAGQSIALAAE